MFTGRFLTPLSCIVFSTAMLISAPLLSAAVPEYPSAGGYAITVSSFLGGKGFDDSVVGARILSDGTIVLATNLGRIRSKKLRVGSPKSLVYRFSADYQSVTEAFGTAGVYYDMAIDDSDNVYVARGEKGIIRRNLITYKGELNKYVGNCTRIDAAGDGHFAGIVDGNILIFDPQGNQIGSAKGKGYTNDVCIDGKSKTVIFCGFRNAHAFDGKKTYPVQICYIKGLSYDGKLKWTNYDWSTDSVMLLLELDIS